LKPSNNEKQDKQNNNINQVQPQQQINQFEGNVIKFGGSNSNIPKKENFKEVWTDLIDFEVAMSKALENKQATTKTVNPTPVSVNSLLKDPPKIRTFKLDTPMFDETQLHIRKAVFTKKIQVENLFISPNMPTPEELAKQEEEENNKDNKSKTRVTKKSDLQQQTKSKPPAAKKKQTVEPQDEYKDSDKIFDSSNKIEKDGQKFDVQKKIYMGQENNFTFQITVPDKLTVKKDEDDGEREEDARVKIAKKKFEKKENERSIYLPGMDQQNEKVNSILQQEEKRPAHKKSPTKVNLSDQNQMLIPNQINKNIKSTNANQNNNEANVNFNNNNNSYRRISLETQQPTKVIRDEQHMHVFKTFKVDTFTVVSDDYHQPLDKTVDIKTSQIIKSNIKEEPKPESKFFEVKKDLVDNNIKKIERKKDPDQVNQDLGGGENQVPINNTIVKELTENLNPSAAKEVTGLNLGGMGEFNMGAITTTTKKATEKKQSIISNFAPEDGGNYNETMNLSRMSKFSKLDLEEVWDNSILGDDNQNFFNNSLDYKNK
jgi:hypothetical protein